MRSRYIAMLVIAALPFRSVASGIPTVDIANLVQNIADYSQQLTQYTEQMLQSTIQGNQLVQQVTELEQMYQEYDHMLNQLEGMRDYFDEATWEDILDRTDIDFPRNPLEGDWDRWGVTVYTDDGVIEVDEEISNVHDRIEDLGTVNATLSDVFTGDELNQQEAIAERHYLRSRELTAQKYSVDYFTSKQEQYALALTKMENARQDNATESETELRTLQTMAAQKELELHQQKTQNDLLLKIYAETNKENAERKQRESYTYQVRLEQMKEQATRDPYVADSGRTSSVSF